MYRFTSSLLVSEPCTFRPPLGVPKTNVICVDEAGQRIWNRAVIDIPMSVAVTQSTHDQARAANEWLDDSQNGELSGANGSLGTESCQQQPWSLRSSGLWPKQCSAIPAARQRPACGRFEVRFNLAAISTRDPTNETAVPTAMLISPAQSSLVGTQQLTLSRHSCRPYQTHKSIS